MAVERIDGSRRLSCNGVLKSTSSRREGLARGSLEARWPPQLGAVVGIGPEDVSSNMEKGRQVALTPFLVFHRSDPA